MTDIVIKIDLERYLEDHIFFGWYYTDDNGRTQDDEEPCPGWVRSLNKNDHRGVRKLPHPEDPNADEWWMQAIGIDLETIHWMDFK